MNSELDYHVVKAQMADRIRAAERARMASDGDPEELCARPLTGLASFVARHAADAPGRRMKLEPVDEREKAKSVRAPLTGLASFVARHTPRPRPAACMKPEPCVEDR